MSDDTADDLDKLDVILNDTNEQFGPADDGDEIAEPLDADDEDIQPPADLVELHEVIEWTAAVDAEAKPKSKGGAAK